MFRSNPKTATGIDARLQDIDRRLREVRKAMRDASRGKPVAVPQPVAAPRLARPSRDVPPPSDPATYAPSGTIPEADATATPRDAPLAPDVRWTPPPPGTDPLPTPPRPVRSPVGARPPRGSGEDKQRFASYFSGSFIGARPLREERRVQRNRAIVMMIVVAVATFVVYSLVSR